MGGSTWPSVDEDGLRRFEQAWAAGAPIPIGAALPPADDPRFQATLEELVLVELELSWRSGKGTSVQAYLARFPLLDDPGVVRRLAREELRVRRRHGDSPDPAAFRAWLSDEDIAAILAETPAAAGDARGRYALVAEHARGGMGVVWRALDPELGREVALKQLSDEVVRHSTLRQRFVAEARITAQLEHPGVVPVYDVGALEGERPFYTMKLVRGQTLSDAIAAFHLRPADDPERPVERLRLLNVFLAVTRAVAYAHSRGVIHRDLKPDNVVLGPYGETVVLDWGLARATDDVEAPAIGTPSGSGPRLTQMGTVLGTPTWMSPEHASGDPDRIDASSDVYSLGAILYQLLTGRLPYEGDTSEEVLHKLTTTDPEPPRSVDPSLARALAAICRKAMARDRAVRYAAAPELTDDLERFLADEPVHAYREPPWDTALRWARRHRAAVTSGAVALVLASVGLGIAWVAADRAEQRELHRLERLRAVAVAAEGSAVSQLGAERYAGARALLGGAVEQIRGEAALSDATDRLRARLLQVDALVAFHALAEQAEEAAFLRDDRGAMQAAEDALGALGVFDHGDWWAHLPDEDLPAAALDGLRFDAYRQLVLLAHLRTEQAQRGSPQVWCPAAADAVWLADAFRPARVLSAMADLCVDHTGTDRHPHRPDTPRTAADHQYLAIRALDIDPVARRPGRVDPGACTLLDRAAALAPDHVWTLLWLGRCHHLSGDPLAAQRAFDQAISLRPDHWLPTMMRSGPLLDLAERGGDDRAVGELRRLGLNDVRHALDLAPSEPAAHWLGAATLSRYEVLETEWMVAAADAIDRRADAPLYPAARARLEDWLAWAGRGAEVALERSEEDPEYAFAAPTARTLLQKANAAALVLDAAPDVLTRDRAPRRLASGAHVVRLPLLNGDFEQGLASHWGRGQYEASRPVWWNSTTCRSVAWVTADDRHRGGGSLYVYNPSASGAHIYGTTAQDVRIEPGATYRVSAWSRGNDVGYRLMWIGVDAEWSVRPVMFPDGTSDWTQTTGTFSLDAEIAHVRILSEGPGEIWIDDIVIERVE